MTRGTFFGIGKYAGHFVNYNKLNFEYLRYSFNTLFNFQIFGIPFTGVAICSGTQTDSN